MLNICLTCFCQRTSKVENYGSDKNGFPIPIMLRCSSEQKEEWKGWGFMSPFTT